MRTASLLLSIAIPAAWAQVGMPPPLVPTTPKPAPRPAARSAAPRAAGGTSYKDLKYPELRAPQPPTIARFELSNGVKLLLAENHETPTITGEAVVRTGAVYDPPDQAGLAVMTGALLRSGGTRRMSPDQLDAALEGAGARVESSIGDAMGTVAFHALKRNLAPALALFRDVLTAPEFRADRVDAAKSSLFNSISHRNDDPRLVLRREVFGALFGPGDPRSRRVEYGPALTIQRADVARFYRRYYFPANTLLVFSGDFDAAALKTQLESLFGSWKNDQAAVPETPKPVEKGQGGAYLAVKADARQTYVAFGRAGTTYRDADAPALDVAALVLGGGSESRFAQRRAKPEASFLEDLRAEAPPGLAAPGVATALAVTQTGSASDAAAAVIEDVQKLRSAEATDEEIRAAKELIWIRVCQGLDNRAKAALEAAAAEYYGYPADYLQQYLKRVAAVTKADVLRVAKERLDPAKFTLVVVSRTPALADPRGGTVSKIDLTIPPAPAGPARGNTASSEDARKLLLRAQQASGGGDKLAAVKDMTTKTVYTLLTGRKDEETDQWIAPSILREDGLSSAIGRLIRFTDGSSGWVSNGYGSGPLVGPLLRQIQGDLLRVPISMLLSDRVTGRVLTAVDEQTIEISQGDAMVRVVFDPATGLVSELHYDIPTPQGQPQLIQETLSDYRDVDGIKLPFANAIYQNGEKFGDGAITEIKLNQGLKPEVLQRRP